MPTLNLHLLAFGLTLIWRLNAAAQAFFIDYAENTELIQQRAGRDLRLECNLKDLNDGKQDEQSNILWYFKRCKGNNCYNFEQNDFQSLPCTELHCGKELRLRNVSDSDSGMYKCTLHPYRFDGEHSYDIQLVRTYHLDVQNVTLTGPEFVDGTPMNTSAPLGAQVALSCRVHSVDHPTIRWFHRLPDSRSSSFSSNAILYNGRAYLPIATPMELLVAPQTYLSKLMMKDLRAHDVGFYACVAITYRGHKLREAYLEVDEPEYWHDYDAEDVELPASADLRKFWSLFLMPVGLAMLPLLLWICYLLMRSGTDEEDISLSSTRTYLEVPFDYETRRLAK